MWSVGFGRILRLFDGEWAAFQHGAGKNSAEVVCTGHFWFISKNSIHMQKSVVGSLPPFKYKG
jgi:hypothetical protein